MWGFKSIRNFRFAIHAGPARAPSSIANGKFSGHENQPDKKDTARNPDCSVLRAVIL
jgi:hypothetical protein